MTLTCDPLDFVDAGAALARTYEVTASTRDELLGDLTNCAGMAGSDNAGEQFAGPYDDAVEQVFLGVRSAERASSQLVDLLYATGLNYARADDPNRADVAFPPPDVRATLSTAVTVPPSANGAHEDEPWGWPLLRDAVGYVWPNGDTGRLRIAADAWSLAASGFDAATFPVNEASALVQEQNTPDSPLAVAACTDFRVSLHDIADVSRELGTTCSDFADRLDAARTEAKDELQQFLWESALIGTISAAGSVFTAGAAVAAGGSGFSANVVHYGSKIAAILRALIEASGGTGRALASLAERIEQTMRSMNAAVAARVLSVGAEAPWLSNLRNDLAEKLRSAQVCGDDLLPVEGGPKNGYVVKLDAQGGIRSYSRYDGDGFAINRVDLSGPPHYSKTADGDVPTPHVVDIVKNMHPRTNKVYPKPDDASVRPALSEEIPTP